jgi:hypothetical protein
MQTRVQLIRVDEPPDRIGRGFFIFSACVSIGIYGQPRAFVGKWSFKGKALRGLLPDLRRELPSQFSPVSNSLASDLRWLHGTVALFTRLAAD